MPRRITCHVLLICQIVSLAPCQTSGPDSMVSVTPVGVVNDAGIRRAAIRSNRLDDAAEEELAGVRRSLHSEDEGSVYARQRRVKNEAEQLDAIRLTDGAWIHSSPAGIEIVETVDSYLERSKGLKYSAASRHNSISAVEGSAKSVNSSKDKLCIMVSVNHVDARTHAGPIVGDLAASILDTWGSSVHNDIVRLVFPSARELRRFTDKWGGNGDPRLVAISPGPPVNAALATPSTIRMFGALRKGELGNMMTCTWFMATDVDAYVNTEALKDQLFRRIHYPFRNESKVEDDTPYLVGCPMRAAKNWDKSFYGKWTSGQVGHTINRKLLKAVDWDVCLGELAHRRKNTTLYTVGCDDVETGGCIHRHRPDARIASLDNYLPTQAHSENTLARMIVSNEEPRWSRIQVAHRTSPDLNRAATRLLQQLAKPKPANVIH